MSTTASTTVSVVAVADLVEVRYDVIAPRAGGSVCTPEDAGVLLADAIVRNPLGTVRVREEPEDGRRLEAPYQEVVVTEHLRRRARRLLALSRRLWRDAARAANENANVG